MHGLGWWPASKRTEFERVVDEFARRRRPTVAFGLAKPDADVLRSLKRGKKHANIVLVGPPEIGNIRGYRIVADTNPETKLATMLASGEADGIVRGTLDFVKTLSAYEQLTGEQHTINPALLEDPTRRQFFVIPANNSDGWSRGTRLRGAKLTADFVKGWGIKPKIAVYAGVRHDTYKSKEHETEGVTGALNETYRDAEWIVEQLLGCELKARNCSVDFNPAVEDGYNIHVPVNGMVGNQIFRVVLLCGGKMLAAPILGLSRPYEDSSRTERDMEFHLKWIAALINRKNVV